MSKCSRKFRTVLGFLETELSLVRYQKKVQVQRNDITFSEFPYCPQVSMTTAMAAGVMKYVSAGFIQKLILKFQEPVNTNSLNLYAI